MKERMKWCAGAAVGALFTLAFLRMATMWREWMLEDMIPVMRRLIYAGGMALLVWVLGVMTLSYWKKWKTERVFLLLFIPLSLTMMITTPIGRALDEVDHLQKIWQISVGDWMPTKANGGMFTQPDNMFEGMGDAVGLTLLEVYEQQDVELHMDSLVQVEAKANTGIYPIHNYFPQALGMAIARLFTKNRLIIFYSARLGAWLVSVLLLYYAIRKTPAGKNAILLMSMMPIAMQELASASADGMTIGFTAAFLALVLDLCRRRKRMTSAECLTMFALTFCACTFKLMYFPLAFLLFFIPDDCFGGKGRKRATAGAMIGGTLAVCLGWMLLCQVNYAAMGNAHSVDVMSRIGLILRDPVRYAMTCLRTLMNQADEHVIQMVGAWLSCYNIPIPSGIYVGLIVVFCAAMTREHGLLDGEKRLQVPMILLSGICVFIIFTCLYVWWTPNGDPEIRGIQGRYYLPLVLPVVLSIKRTAKAEGQDGCLYGYALAASLFAIGTLAIVLAYTIC